ncbi:MAG: tetratricopeptide repeat protein [Hyphomonas sp.]|nr:tetratricopeptide repeat protein [Hyphomonas sp.]
MRHPLCAILLFALSGPALAQSEPEVDGEKRLDTVEVREAHPIYGDALAAFNAGDYETAEAEFTLVYEYIRRQINMRDIAFTQGRMSEDVGAGISDLDYSAFLLGVGADYARATRNPNVRQLDRDDMGVPLYMAGLSQIQLGKYAEAKKSFYSALAYRKDIPDIRFRIGLLELRDGDAAKAEKQVKALGKIIRKCTPDCIDEDGNDLIANREILVTGLVQLKAGELAFE